MSTQRKEFHHEDTKTRRRNLLDRFCLLRVFAPCMFQNTMKSCLIQHVASGAWQRSEVSGKRRPPADRSCPGAHDAVTKPDRRRSSVPNPNSRSNASSTRRSSHPQDREAAMQHDSSPGDDSVRTVVGIDVAKATLDCYLDPCGQRLTLANDDNGIA